MPHETTLITTIAIAFVLAFALGFLAWKLRISPLVGYLFAGVLIGPFTPGFVADINLARQLAEVGVILLMFGAGLHLSVKDLMAVRGVAIPGAIAQMLLTTLLGAAMASLWGWKPGTGFIFGLSLSVASTVVLLRALEQRNALSSPEGHVAVGWLIVQDLMMVIALVLLPALADTLGGASSPQARSAGADLWMELALTFGKGCDLRRFRPHRGYACSAVGLDAGGAHGIARALHACGAGGRTRDRVRVSGAF